MDQRENILIISYYWLLYEDGILFIEIEIVFYWSLNKYFKKKKPYSIWKKNPTHFSPFLFFKYK